MVLLLIQTKVTEDELCFCDGVIDLSDKENVRTVKQQRGLITFQSCAAKRNDKKHEDIFANISLPFNVHRKCATDYTRPQTIESHAKLKRSNNKEDCEHLPTPPKLPSSTQGFSEKANCLFCAKPIQFDQSRVPLDRRRSCSDFTSVDADLQQLNNVKN